MKALGILERDDKPDFVGKCEIKHTFDKYDKSMQPVPDTRYIPEMTNEGYVLIPVIGLKGTIGEKMRLSLDCTESTMR